MTKNLGMIFLSVYLLIVGFSAFVPVMAGLGLLASISAIIAGILILMGR